MLLERSVALVVALTGVVRSGCAYLPLDPTLPAERLQYMCQRANVRLLVTQEQHRAAWQEAAGLELYLMELEELAVQAASIRLDWTIPEVTTSPKSLLYVMFTSGSTGQPKGVAVEHAGVANQLHWAAGPACICCRRRRVASSSWSRSVWAPMA